ncbi:MAG: cytochrome c3 family protein, partial [Candidatus Methanoperedens sp.]|nr:cytochrome c3 family protein [Candidatus Methanoperedens sp.]
SIHPVQYLQPDTTFTINSASNKSSAVNCTNCHQATLTGFETAPLIPSVLKHSSNATNGSIWNITAYWTSNNESCYYCHGNTKHNTTALGTINALLTDLNNTRNGTLTSTQWCADCHLNIINTNYIGTLWSPIPPLITINNTGMSTWINHSGYFGSGYKDENCRSCHPLNTSGTSYSSTSLNYSHSLDEGIVGGRNCVGCHDIGGSTPRVDVNTINRSIHMNLNLNSTSTFSSDNKPCWACHTNFSITSNNIINESDLPSTGHPDSYNTPKLCTQCHTQGNFSATIVNEHNSAGTDIRTKPYSDTNESCISCHNKSELIQSNNDPGSPRNEFANVSHYGDNKTGDLPYNTGISSNCSYCHQNISTSFTTEMVNSSWNTSIQNHTALGTNPGCTNIICHNTGRIHDSSLTKPAVITTLCTTCHITKSKHNSSLDCISCHLETNKSIHPVQYLQPDTTFTINSASNKSSAVNCTNCHQATLTGFETAPLIPS